MIVVIIEKCQFPLWPAGAAGSEACRTQCQKPVLRFKYHLNQSFHSYVVICVKSLRSLIPKLGVANIEIVDYRN